MAGKRLNPYQRLLKEVGQYCRSVYYRERKIFWTLKKDKTYSISTEELATKIDTADLLGYEVQARKDDNGDIVFFYVEKIKERRDWARAF